MTIEERDTARAIQTIARELNKPAQPKEIDWEERLFQLAKDIYIARLSLDQERLCLTEEGDMEVAIELASSFIEEYQRSQTKKTE